MPEPTERAAGTDGVQYRNLLVDRHPAAQVVLSPGGIVLFWSGAAAELFGYTPREAVGRPVDLLITPAVLRDDRRPASFREELARGCACQLAERHRKDGSQIQVQLVFDSVTSGGTLEYVIMSARAADTLARSCASAPVPAARTALAELTPRQLDVLRLISGGWPTRDIARKLRISAKTVETHRAHLMRRLRVRSVAGLVRFAVWAGVVPPEP